MIKIIVLIAIFIVVLWIQNRKFNEDKNRINELEDRLDEYYKKRENRLIKKFRDIENNNK